MEKIYDILDYRLVDLESYQLRVSQILVLVAIIIGVKLLLIGIRKGINRSKKLTIVGQENRDALFQIIRYFVWVVAILFMLEGLGVKVTVLLAGSAALLVGIGLGLQQIFNDLVSGIILLVEGNVRVGDVLEIDSDVVRVREIGLRTSKVIDRNDIIIIMPNSKMVSDKVINWSHQVTETRFRIKVGTDYGSDVDLVLELLVKAAESHNMVSKKRKPEARFVDFGESSLNFEILFWSDEKFLVETVLSDIRRTINQLFRDNNVSIPFPHRTIVYKDQNENKKFK